MPEAKNNGNLNVAKVFCTGCGKFKGVSGVKTGFFVVFCRDCKKNTVVLGENEPLETIQMLANLPDNGPPKVLTKSNTSDSIQT